MINGKARGPDGISVETIKAGGASLDQHLASLYTKCLKKITYPKTGNLQKWFSFLRGDTIRLEKP